MIRSTVTLVVIFAACTAIAVGLAIAIVETMEAILE